jgi:hypothetical protein
MSIKARLQKFQTKSRTKLPNAVVAIIYKGQEFNGLANKTGEQGEQVTFSEASDDMSHVKFDVADCDSDPTYGDKISIADEDRLIKKADKDAWGVSWMVDHVEYYSKYATITDPTEESVYEYIKCRVIDPEIDQFNQFDDDLTEMLRYEVVVRQDDWSNDSKPNIGFKVVIDGYDDFYVLEVNEISGDYRLTCRKQGSNP